MQNDLRVWVIFEPQSFKALESGCSLYPFFTEVELHLGKWNGWNAAAEAFRRETSASLCA